MSKISSYGGDYYYQGYYDYYGYGESGKSGNKASRLALSRVNDKNNLTAGLRERENKRVAKRVTKIDDRRNRRDPSIVDVD